MGKSPFFDPSIFQTFFVEANTFLKSSSSAFIFHHGQLQISHTANKAKALARTPQKRSREFRFKCPRCAECMEYLPTFALKFMVHVGKYTVRPMDPMGAKLRPVPPSRFFCFSWKASERMVEGRSISVGWGVNLRKFGERFSSWVWL